MRKVVIGVLLLALASSALDICDRQEDGTRLAHPLECAKYVVCFGQQTSQIASCPNGLHFNRHLGACDLKSRAGCEAGVRAPSEVDAAATDCSCCSCCCCDDCCSSTPAPGPSTPGPSTPGPSTPGPSTPGPSTPGPSTPGPSTPGPSTPGPSTPAPGPSSPAPGPSTPAPGPGTPAPGPSTGPSGTSCDNPGLCVGQKDGTMFADSSSNGYIVCQCECEIQMPCPEGLVFNTAVNVCDWPKVN